MNRSRMATIAPMMAALALSACGGGGGDSAPSPAPAPAPTPALTAGIFSVNYQGQFSGIYTFLDGNRFSGVHFVDGVGLAGHPHGMLPATNSTSSRDRISWANFIDDDAQVGAQEPHGVFGRTFTSTGVNVSITGSMGSFATSAAQQLQYSDGSGKTLYDNPIALSVAAGSYSGYVRTVGLGETVQTLTRATLDDSGQIVAAVSDCRYAGTVTAHGSTGVYDAQVTATGPGCAFSGGLSGILAPMSFDGTNASWALQLDTADNAQTAVFILQKP